MWMDAHFIVEQLLDQFQIDQDRADIDPATLRKMIAYAEAVVEMEAPSSLSNEDRYNDFLRYNAQVHGDL